MGTGLGPTLEFYALVSTELQRCDLGLWNESDSYKRKSTYISDIIKRNTNNIENEPTSLNNTGSGDVGTGAVISNNEGSLNMLIEQTAESFMVVNNQPEDYYNVDTSSLIVQTMDEIVHSTPQQPNDMPVLSPQVTVPVAYVNPPNGLFPAPIGKSAKLGHISKIRMKYRFLGKFMAKAVMDSRMVGVHLF